MWNKLNVLSAAALEDEEVIVKTVKGKGEKNWKTSHD